ARLLRRADPLLPRRGAVRGRPRRLRAGPRGSGSRDRVGALRRAGRGDPRRLGDRRAGGSGRTGRPGAAQSRAVVMIDRAVRTYLDHLTVEKGLATNTL